MNRLAGQAAIVTGGGSGIGRAIAMGLAGEGAAVTVADIAEDDAQAVAAEITAAGGTADAALTDVTSARDVERLAAGVLERRGRIDVLVACAGVCRVRPILELSEEEVVAMWRVHALGTFLCAKAVAPTMIEQGYGRIVAVVSGQDGYGASPWTAHYQSAKSAQTTFARSLALALAEHGVTVNCISPGLVVTPLWDGLNTDYQQVFGRSAQQEIAGRLADRSSFPRGRPTDPEEVAHAAVFLCLPESGAINGEVLNL